MSLEITKAAGFLPTYEDLSFNMLVQLHEKFPGSNVFFSPVGLGFSLSMAASGNTGKTGSEIKDILGFATDEDLNSINLDLLHHLVKIDPPNKIRIANSVWTRMGKDIRPDYLEMVKQFYQANAASVDFTKQSTMDRINSWVKAQTEGKITDIVSLPMPTATAAVLLNAIYFKGDWAVEFDKSKTQTKPFRLANGNQINIPRMMRADPIDYFENNEMQIAALPFVNDALDLIVILPRKNLEALFHSLTATNFFIWTRHLMETAGRLELPKLELQTFYNFNAPLMAMGMKTAFDQDSADFRNISPSGMWINRVEQKVYVKLDEEGAEAAAATSAVAVDSIIHRQNDPFSLIVDSPFLLAIREEATGALLFLGVIMDPR